MSYSNIFNEDNNNDINNKSKCKDNIYNNNNNNKLNNNVFNESNVYAQSPQYLSPKNLNNSF